MANIISINFNDDDFAALNVATKKEGVSRSAYVTDAVHKKLVGLNLEAFYAEEKESKINKPRKNRKAGKDARIVSVYFNRANYTLLERVANKREIGLGSVVNDCVAFALNGESIGNFAAIDYMAERISQLLNPNVVSKIKAQAISQFCSINPLEGEIPLSHEHAEPEPQLAVSNPAELPLPVLPESWNEPAEFDDNEFADTE